MALEKIKTITGKGVVVAGNDIDTDRIIPARFMKCVTFDGLGEFLFHDVRKDENGKTTNHNLDQAEHSSASIIISGNNFGCGSSREHAPQAIYKAGFRAIIAEGYAEIFFGNSTNLGIPCVSASKKAIQKLKDAIEKDPSIELSIELETLKINFGSDSIDCELRTGARDSLIAGRWDTIADLLESKKAVAEKISTLRYMNAN